MWKLPASLAAAKYFGHPTLTPAQPRTLSTPAPLTTIRSLSLPRPLPLFLPPSPLPLPSPSAPPSPGQVNEELKRYNSLLLKLGEAADDEWEAVVAAYRGDLQKPFFEHMQCLIAAAKVRV